MKRWEWGCLGIVMLMAGVVAAIVLLYVTTPWN